MHFEEKLNEYSNSKELLTAGLPESSEGGERRTIWHDLAEEHREVLLTKTSNRHGSRQLRGEAVGVALPG
jgi:hypothetical protein